MKARLLRIGCVSIALATGVACATSNEENQEPTNASTPSTDDAGTQLPDGPDTADAGRDADVVVSDGAVPTCSPDGWCATKMPDPDTSFYGISALDNAAFAMTNNTSLGAKILGWKPETGWSYIDDGSQQSTVWVPRTIYAPSEDDVYFFLADYSMLIGGASLGGIVFHGKRPVGTSKTWTWTHQSFPCADFDEGMIGGVGPDDVYMEVCSTIYRLTSKGEDGGADTWTPVYTDDDPTHFSLRSMSGVADDVWFYGSRNSLFTVGLASCEYILRKTSAGFEKVADGTLDAAGCTEKPGVLMLEPADSGLGYAGIFSVLSGSALLYGDNKMFRVSKGTSDRYELTKFTPNLFSTGAILSVWGASNDDLWMIGSGGPGSALVIRGEQIASASPKYSISSIAINGAPNLESLNFVTGTSTSNLWVVGNDTAYHKTTP